MQNQQQGNYVVGLFEQHQHAQEAAERLLALGISQDRISVQQNRRATNTEVHTQSKQLSVNRNTLAGVAIGGGAGIALGLLAWLTPEISGVVGGGAIPLGLMGAGVGAIGGGIIGAMNHMGVPNCGRLYEEAIQRGATVVSVAAVGKEASNAGEVMKQSGALCVDLDGGAQRRGGWQEVPSAATPDAPKPANQPKVNVS
jgi:hypothetical protein